MKARLSFLMGCFALITVWQRADVGVAARDWIQGGSTGASVLPISLTGWDADVIWPGISTGFDGGGYAWIQESSKYRGFPSSGRFTSEYNSNVVFQLQPFTGSNALLL